MSTTSTPVRVKPGTIAATAAQLVALARGMGRLCDHAVHHLHDPGEPLRDLVREIERRVPACCTVSLGGVVTSIELATEPDTIVRLEIFDDARKSTNWKARTTEAGLLAGEALLAIIAEGAQPLAVAS